MANFNIKNFSVVTAAAATLLLAGCQNTAEGVSQDAERNTQEVAKVADETVDRAADAAENAGEAASQAAQNAGAATMLTPRLKTAITADAQLNEPTNTINVESTNDTVTLRGNVTTEALKRRAEEVVRNEMKEANASQKLVNELQVNPRGT